MTVFEGEVVTAIPCPLDTTDDQVNNAVEDGWLLATNKRGDKGKVPENVCYTLALSLSNRIFLNSFCIFDLLCASTVLRGSDERGNR